MLFRLFVVLGVNFLIRKVAKQGSPTMHISLEGGKVTVKTEAGFTTRAGTFPLDGAEVEEDNPAGGGKSKVSRNVDC